MPVTFAFAGHRIERRQILLVAGAVLGCVALAFAYRFIDIAAIHRRAEGLNGALVFVLMTVLPLFGFPVTVTHAVAGMRFGLPLGLALVAVSIALQLLLSYALVKALPGFFAKRLGGIRRRLPRAAHTPLTIFTMLLPGVPYFAQNYVLPLVGVPLAPYLLWGLSIHVARSVVGVAFGDFSDNLTPARLAGFGAYLVAIMVGCAWSLRRLRAQMKDRPPAGDDRKRPASTPSAAPRRAPPRSAAK